jgi:hypothetical protein
VRTGCDAFHRSAIKLPATIPMGWWSAMLSGLLCQRATGLPGRISRQTRTQMPAISCCINADANQAKYIMGHSFQAVVLVAAATSIPSPGQPNS